MRSEFFLRRICMRYTRFLWLAPLALAWSSALAPAQADSGFLKSLSLSAAKGAGALDIDFTVKELTLTSTTSTPDATNFDFSFSGTLDFGDGSAPATGFPLTLDKQTKRGGKEGTVVWRDELKGVVSHTYPAEGTYSAKLAHCCLADTYVSYGYVSVTSSGEPLESTVNVTITPPAACEGETLFQQLDCLFDEINAAVDNAGITRPGVLSTLKNQLEIAKGKKEDTIEQCAIGQDLKAKTALTAASVKVQAFVNTVDKNPYVDDGVEAGLIAQGTPIKDIMDGLILNGVCAGNECLADPPLGALHCETQKLADEIGNLSLDEALAIFFSNKLDDLNDRRDDIIAACEAGKAKQAIGKVKAALAVVKSVNAKLNVLEKKGTLPLSIINALREGLGRAKAVLDGLLLNGACQ